MVADLVCDALEGRNRIMDIDLSATPAHNLRHLGVGANHRDRGELLAIEWQDVLFVPEQDDPLGSRFPHQSAMLRQIEGLLWHGFRVSEEARFD